MAFKDISYLQFWQPACLSEQNHLGNFVRGHYGNISAKLICICTSVVGCNLCFAFHFNL